MGYFEAFILGLLQGLTEFLPVSSSGHLVIAEHLMKAKMPGVTFELIVHLGTLLSVLVYFRKRTYNLISAFFIKDASEDRKTIALLAIGTVPAVIVALLFKDKIESTFSSPVMTSILLMFTGLFLLLTALPRKQDKVINWPKSILIGLGQAMAIFPGISRSGATIAAGLFAGVKPMLIAEFSFLLSIPAIGGALIFKYKELLNLEPMLWGQYLVGMIVSFLSGLLAVYILLDFIRKGKFKYFGIYCLALGLIGLIYFV
jgi:undecaprenyl-diphosphatase